MRIKGSYTTALPNPHGGGRLAARNAFALAARFRRFRLVWTYNVSRDRRFIFLRLAARSG